MFIYILKADEVAKDDIDQENLYGWEKFSDPMKKKDIEGECNGKKFGIGYALNL